MVTLNKIYTKTGDSGETSLGDGSRVSKTSVRISAYGTVDEVNSVIGICRLHASDADDETLDNMLSIIQNDLFDLGADLCVPSSDKNVLRITSEQIIRLEDYIDIMNKDLPPLKSFILPGGTALSSHLHLARTVTRRAERLVVELSKLAGEIVNPRCIRYLNRLSDFLFVLARYTNEGDDILWVPGEHR